MSEFIFRLGYLGLFIISFLAASLLPMSSEVFVLGMPRMGYGMWGVIIVATLGNFFGKLLNYYVGKKGSEFFLARYFEVKPQMLHRAERLFQKWGHYTLFFSWLPFIGDPLTAVAGILRVRLAIFVFWVLLGNFLRYVALLGIAAPLLDWLL